MVAGAHAPRPSRPEPQAQDLGARQVVQIDSRVLIHTTPLLLLRDWSWRSWRRDNPFSLMTIASRYHPFPSRTGP